jgi:hypothetical protein
MTTQEIDRETRLTYLDYFSEAVELAIGSPFHIPTANCHQKGRPVPDALGPVAGHGLAQPWSRPLVHC